MPLKIVRSKSSDLAAQPAIRGIIDELEKHFIDTIDYMEHRDQSLQFNFDIQHGKAQSFGIQNVTIDQFHRYDLGSNHRPFFVNVTSKLELWEQQPFHKLSLQRSTDKRWQATIAVDFDSLQREEHVRYVERAMVKRRQWLAEYLAVPAIQVYDLHYPSMPFPIDPMWPSYRFSFLIGYTKQYIWLMSNGLSNPLHPGEDDNWKTLERCHNVELLSRIPKDGLGDDDLELATLLRNRYVSTFLGITGTVSLTDGFEFSNGPRHRFLDISYDRYTTNPPTSTDVGFFLSDLQSLRIAEPIAQPDSDYPRIAVQFATLMRRAEADTANDDALRVSRELMKEDRIGLLGPDYLQEQSSINF